MQLLRKLYKTYSPSGNERKMKRFIRSFVAENCPTATIYNDNAGNLYVVKGSSDTYPCVVAHLDQVQRIHSKDFTAVQAGQIIIGYSPSNKQQEGLGADDKNGIWVALKCLVKYPVMKVAFFVQEEVGCIGSSKCDMEFFDDCRFVLQCDRRNGGDLITNIWNPIATDEFIEATGAEFYGYRPCYGAMTDVATLKDRGLKVSALNISCGYYEPHTDVEFTIIDELWNCLCFVQHIIENCTDVYPAPLLVERLDGIRWDEYDSDFYFGDPDTDEALHDKYVWELSEMMEREMMVKGPEFSIDTFYSEHQDDMKDVDYDVYVQIYEALNG